jgi:hypothetical protein
VTPEQRAQYLRLLAALYGTGERFWAEVLKQLKEAAGK